MKKYLQKCLYFFSILFLFIVIGVVGGCGSEQKDGQEKRDNSSGSGASVSGSEPGDSTVSGSTVNEKFGNSVSGGNITVMTSQLDVAKEQTESRLDYYDDQLLLLWENRSMWIAREDKTSDLDGTNLEPYTRYAVTDLDRNGRLEIISSSTNDSGADFSVQYLEVDKNRQKLKLCTTVTKDSRGRDRMPELWYSWGDAVSGLVSAEAYYDKKTAVWHYAIEKAEGKTVQDFVLQKGKIEIKSVKNKKNYYKGMTKCQMSACWFMSCEKELDVASGKYRQYSDEEILKSMKTSWNKFTIVSK